MLKVTFQLLSVGTDIAFSKQRVNVNCCTNNKTPSLASKTNNSIISS